MDSPKKFFFGQNFVCHFVHRFHHRLETSETCSIEAVFKPRPMKFEDANTTSVYLNIGIPISAISYTCILSRLMGVSEVI